MERTKFTFKLAGKDVVATTGDFAMLAQGAVMLQMGGTVLLATAAVAKQDTDLDYFPLGVEFVEKWYAAGALSNERFRKREGRPSDEAVIKAREVDHSIRSLFPKSWKRPVSVVLTVMAYDGINDPQALTVFGASLALMQSGVPFAGPCASLIISIDKDNNFIMNAPAHERSDYEAEFIVSAVDGKLLSLEGWGKEIKEETMDLLLDEADKEIRKINEQQREFISKVGTSMEVDAAEYPNIAVPEEVVAFVKEKKLAEITEVMFSEADSRRSKLAEITSQLVELITEDDESTFTKSDISGAVDYVARYALRQGVLKEDKRISGRGLTEIRDLRGEVDMLPTVHGSAMFNRGLTQSLSIVTLGAKRNALMIDDMMGNEEKHFMHHYNFPSFSVGEAGRYNYYAGRREVGHGAIGENALMNMIPSVEEFPYTIRVVSEILTSNGSTSMAATCASSMALMATGVPMKEAVAGIGVGLVTEDDNEDNYKLLLDIEGTEDFYGDMDFKVCGSKNGITAIQYENKLQGVSFDVIKEAFRLAKSGRFQLLEVMNSVISESRKELPESAPKVVTTNIDPESIRDLIGPGGKVIQGLIADAAEIDEADKSEPDINIEDDGAVIISSTSRKQIDFILNYIKMMFERPEEGGIYDGVIDKVMEYGAFVNVTPQISGLIHKSNIADEFVENPSEHLKEGDKVKVKLTKIERGKLSFSTKPSDLEDTSKAA